MEKRDALLRVVKAARIAAALAEHTGKLMVDGSGWSWADEIAANLAEALYIYSGEELGDDKDFLTESKVACMIRDAELSDMQMAIAIRLMHSENTTCRPVISAAGQMPDREVGYHYTPEGEFT